MGVMTELDSNISAALSKLDERGRKRPPPPPQPLPDMDDESVPLGLRLHRAKLALNGEK